MVLNFMDKKTVQFNLEKNPTYLNEKFLFTC